MAFDAIRAAVERARGGLGPQAIEAVTLRLHGHAAHDDARYVPQDLRDAYEGRDPVERMRARLLLDGLSPDELDAVDAEEVAGVAAALDEAESSPATGSCDARGRRLGGSPSIIDSSTPPTRSRGLDSERSTPDESRAKDSP